MLGKAAGIDGDGCRNSLGVPRAEEGGAQDGFSRFWQFSLRSGRMRMALQNFPFSRHTECEITEL